MSDVSRRLVERIVDPAYLEGLDRRSAEEIRAMREECRDGEAEVSFERRLTQARIDILSAELARRSGEAEGDLISRLPQILAGEASSGDSPLPARAPDLSLPRNVDVPRRRVEEIVGEQTLARLPHSSNEEIEQIVASLREHERNLSRRRRQIHEVLDRLEAVFVSSVRASNRLDSPA